MEKGKIKISKQMLTSKYDLFAFLPGNRDITPRKVDNLAKSIETIGWLGGAIVVNEFYQIIDGQNRFCACRKLKMPVPYVVAPGAGLREARMLNSMSKNWNTHDYIVSYATDGNINYLNFLLLEKKYPKLSMTTIAAIVSGYLTHFNTITLRNGEFKLPTERLNDLFLVFDYIMENYDSLAKIEGRKDTVFSCVAWIISNTKVNKKRLASVLKKGIFSPVSESAPKRFLEQLSYEYNKGKTKDLQIKFDALYELSK